MAPRAAVLTLALFAAIPAMAEEATPPEIPAAWTMHQIDLTYMGFTTRYTCGGLKSKMKLLLKTMGVRDDVKIVSLNIDENQETASRYQVMSIPTMIVFKAGEPAKTIVGAMSKQRLEQELVPALA